MDTSFEALSGWSTSATLAAAKVAAQRELWALEWRKKALLARDSLIDYAELMTPDIEFPLDPNVSRYRAQAFHRAIARALEKAERLEIRKLILTAPPRHGKSQLSSVLLPSHIIGRDPYANIIIGCYNEPLAKGFGRKIRRMMMSTAYKEVFPGTHLEKGGKAANLLVTAEDGMIAAVGRKGTTTGRGANFFLVDDPVKDRREMKSPTMRDEIWDWFQDVVSTRLMSDLGVIIILMTRWHDDDIIGRLTDPDNPHYVEEEAAGWQIINLPALAEEDDPLGRQVDEALWPEQFSAEYLKAFRRKNPLGFSALYQQRPTPDDGDYFSNSMFVTYERPSDRPKNLRMFAASDHAVKAGQKHDKTCIIVAGVCSQGLVWIVDIIWKRIDTLKQVDEMLAVQSAQKPVRWWAGRDHITGSIGPFLYREMRKQKKFINLTELPDKEDKVQKAQPFIALMAGRQVRWPAYHANFQAAKQEMLKFDNAPHDDIVDALANLGRGLENVLRAFEPKPAANVYKMGTFGWLKQSAARAANENKVTIMRTG